MLAGIRKSVDKIHNFTDAGTLNYYSTMVETVGKTLLNKLRTK
jgi:hypothetical protein